MYRSYASRGSDIDAQACLPSRGIASGAEMAAEQQQVMLLMQSIDAKACLDHLTMSDRCKSPADLLDVAIMSGEHIFFI